MSDEEYGKKYARQMGIAYPDAASRGFFGDLAYKAATSSLWGAPANTMENASIWADNQIDMAENPALRRAQENATYGQNYAEQMALANGKQAPLSLIEKAQQALNNSSDFSAGEWANRQIDMAENPVLRNEAYGQNYAEQMALANGKQPYITGTAAGDATLNKFNDLVSMSIFSDPAKWAEDEIIKQEKLQADKQLLAEQRKTMPYLTGSPQNLSDEDFARTYKEQMNLAQPSPTGTPVGDWMLKTGKNLYDWSIFNEVDGMSPNKWADAQIDRIEADRAYNTPEAIEARKVAEEREAQTQAGIWADSQIDLQEAAQAEAKAAKEKEMIDAGIWADDEITRIETARRFEAKAAEEAKAKEMEAAGVWATDEIVRQETEQLAAKRAAEESKKQRLAAIQAGIDEDATRTTQENYELAAGIEYDGNLTPNIILDSVTEAMEGNDEESEEKAGILATWIKEASESTYLVDTAKKWGNIVVTALGLTDNDEKEDLTEKEIEIIIAAEDELTPPGGSSDTNVVPGVLSDGTTTTTTNTNVVPGVLGDGTSPKVTNTNVFNATASSTEGFTMDRLKNPLSPENKAWWLGGGGGVPGNNRAKEFFETLAYIGTPLKYRPSKTPGQQNIENRMAQMNNVMDYNASMATTNASNNQNTFTKLKAAIPSTTDLEKELAPAFYDKAGMFEKSSETDRKIKARAYQIHEAMTIMASKGIFPTVQKVYADEAEAKRIADEKKRIEEEERARIEALKPKSDGNGLMGWFGELF